MAQGIDIGGFLRKLAAGDFIEAKSNLGLNQYQQRVNFASEALSRLGVLYTHRMYTVHENCAILLGCCTLSHSTVNTPILE